MTRRRDVLAAGAALAAGTALAQGGLPERPVRLIVPNPPGGPSDIVARLLADTMRDALGQSLVVDNRPGAAGLIGTIAIATAPADGHAVPVTSRSNHVIAPPVQKSTQVDPVRDLAPVGLALRAVGMLASNSASNFRTLKHLIAYAKAHPGRLNYGSAGIGATNHIAVEQFKSLAGIDVTHVPYKGSGPLVTALIGNEVQLALLDFSSAQPGLKGGTIVPLAQTAARRLPTLAGVPTLAESGFADFDASFWIGLAVPKNTPAHAVRRLNEALNVALADSRVKAYAQANGWELAGGPPQMLADTIAADLAQLPVRINRLEIKPG